MDLSRGARVAQREEADQDPLDEAPDLNPPLSAEDYNRSRAVHSSILGLDPRIWINLEDSDRTLAKLIPMPSSARVILYKMFSSTSLRWARRILLDTRDEAIKMGGLAGQAIIGQDMLLGRVRP
jgi:hypothetical protein